MSPWRTGPSKTPWRSTTATIPSPATRSALRRWTTWRFGHWHAWFEVPGPVRALYCGAPQPFDFRGSGAAALVDLSSGAIEARAVASVRFAEVAAHVVPGMSADDALAELRREPGDGLSVDVVRVIIHRHHRRPAPGRNPERTHRRRAAQTALFTEIDDARLRLRVSRGRGTRGQHRRRVRAPAARALSTARPRSPRRGDRRRPFPSRWRPAVSTRLAGLSLQRFRNLPEFSIELDAGLVLVRGPNEAGKSSLVEAVFFALFRDAGSTAREIAQAITWGLSSRPVVELTLEVDGEEYLLRRDYAAKKNLLRNATTGDEWHDKKTIAAKVARSCSGLETEALVRSTVCVQADELQKVGEAGDDLRVLLEQKMSGVGDVDLGAIDERLDKEIREIRPPRKRDVGLWKADDDVARLRRDATTSSSARSTSQAKTRADVLRRSARAAGASGRARRQVACPRARGRLRRREDRHEAADAALERAIERLRRSGRPSSSASAASTELDRLRPLLQVAEREAEIEARAAADRELLADRLAHAETDAARLEKIPRRGARVRARARRGRGGARHPWAPLPARGEVQRLLAVKTTIETVEVLRCDATGDPRSEGEARCRAAHRRPAARSASRRERRGRGPRRGDRGHRRSRRGACRRRGRRAHGQGERVRGHARRARAAGSPSCRRPTSPSFSAAPSEPTNCTVARRGAADRLAAIAGEGTTDDLASRLAEARADAERLRSELAAEPAAGEGAVARRDRLRAARSTSRRSGSTWPKAGSSTCPAKRS